MSVHCAIYPKCLKKNMVIAIIIAVVCLLFYIYIQKNFKMPKTDSMVCVNGGVKSGKSTFSYALSRSIYKRNLRQVKFRNFVRRLFNKLFKKEYKMEELPVFYTTIPVDVPHTLLTLDMLKRDVRFAYKSVIWVDEASLLCDSQSYKDLDINDRLMLFNKLIAHETKGGSIVYNTQSIADLHYSVKRCLAETFYVHHTYKWIPFFLVCTVREERYSEDGMVVNSYNEDIENTLKRVIIPKRVWKEFDCYAYSSMTDNLPVANTQNKPNSLKAERIVSFNERHNIEIKEYKHEKEKS